MDMFRHTPDADPALYRSGGSLDQLPDRKLQPQQLQALWAGAAAARGKQPPKPQANGDGVPTDLLDIALTIPKLSPREAALHAKAAEVLFRLSLPPSVKCVSVQGSKLVGHNTMTFADMHDRFVLGENRPMQRAGQRQIRGSTCRRARCSYPVRRNRAETAADRRQRRHRVLLNRAHSHHCQGRRRSWS